MLNNSQPISCTYILHVCLQNSRLRSIVMVLSSNPCTPNLWVSAICVRSCWFIVIFSSEWVSAKCWKSNIICSLASLSFTWVNYFPTHLVSITWHLIHHYDVLLILNFPHQTLTRAINWFMFERYRDLLDLSVSACSLIVRINGCWTMTFSAIQQTGNPHWLDCILLWYYHLALFVFTHKHSQIWVCFVTYTCAHAEAGTQTQ